MTQRMDEAHADPLTSRGMWDVVRQGRRSALLALLLLNTITGYAGREDCAQYS